MHSRGTVLLVAAVCAGCGSSHRAPRPLHVRNSYLGLACANAFPCAHLGIAVWLQEPAARVTALIHGHRVALSTHYDHRRDWIGFVRDPAAESLSDDIRRKVQLTVEATGPDGIIRRATLRRPVSPGWG